MSGEGFPWVQGVKSPTNRSERPAPEALQRRVQELGRHVMQKPLHNPGRALYEKFLLKNIVKPNLKIAQPVYFSLANVGSPSVYTVYAGGGGLVFDSR